MTEQSSTNQEDEDIVRSWFARLTPDQARAVLEHYDAVYARRFRCVVCGGEVFDHCKLSREKQQELLVSDWCSSKCEDTLEKRKSRAQGDGDKPPRGAKELVKDISPEVQAEVARYLQFPSSLSREAQSLLENLHGAEKTDKHHVLLDRDDEFWERPSLAVVPDVEAPLELDGLDPEPPQGPPWETAEHLGPETVPDAGLPLPAMDQATAHAEFRAALDRRQSSKGKIPPDPVFSKLTAEQLFSFLEFAGIGHFVISPKFLKPPEERIRKKS